MNRIFRFRPCHRNGGSKESCRFERGQPHQTRRCRCDDQVRQREKVTYTNFKMFSFELDGEEPRDSSTEPQPTVDEGEIDDNRLPF